jgi:hypothetical protein
MIRTEALHEFWCGTDRDAATKFERCIDKRCKFVSYGSRSSIINEKRFPFWCSMLRGSNRYTKKRYAIGCDRGKKWYGTVRAQYCILGKTRQNYILPKRNFIFMRNPNFLFIFVENTSFKNRLKSVKGLVTWDPTVKSDTGFG